MSLKTIVKVKDGKVTHVRLIGHDVPVPDGWQVARRGESVGNLYTPPHPTAI